jgi:hypothetical protein
MVSPAKVKAGGYHHGADDGLSSTSMMSIVEVAAALELARATAYPSREASAVNELLRELHALMKRREPHQMIRLVWCASGA